MDHLSCSFTYVHLHECRVRSLLLELFVMFANMAWRACAALGVTVGAQSAKLALANSTASVSSRHHQSSHVE